ncbi:MAG: hypothetical protein N4A33_08035 [Bacteriovoracaceae bacterium]|jgi:hypothetical protein|nr:hypothetical protein [Bacteriovoracaceae bacterium]
MKTFILLSIICFNVFALTQKEINVIFEKYYYSNQISSRHCGKNTDLFLKTLFKKGLDKDIAINLYIESPLSSWGFGQLVATNARWGKKYDYVTHTNWYFHVVTLIDNMIYDFSFNNTPRVIDLRTYLNEMFIPQNSFMPYGESFRIGSVDRQGPYYTKENAIKNLKLFNFSIRMYDDENNLVEIEKLKLEQLLNIF